MQVFVRAVWVRLAAASLFAVLAHGCGGAGGTGSDWYYHWSCHGDSECLATNPGSQTSGTAGPISGGQIGCNELMTFGSRFWNIPPATQSCDQSPTGTGGGTDAGGSGGGGVVGAPTINYVTPGGVPGTVISVSGTNFPSSAAGVTVTIGGVTATISTATTTNLNVIVPNLNGGSYPLVVTTAGGSASSTFAVGQKHPPSKLVVDASSVYWLEDDGSVKKVPIAGGAVTALATGLLSPRDLAQDSTSLYFTDLQAGKVQRVAKSGGTVTTLASSLTSPFAIAVDSSNVYFVENGNSTLSKVAKTGGAVTALVNGSITGDVLAVDGSGLYYFDPTQVIYKASLAGGVGTMLENVIDKGPSMVLDSTSVYWGFSGLRRVAVGGGTPTTYTAPIGRVGGLAVDSSSLYYVNLSLDASAATGQIASVPLQDGAVTVLVQSSGAVNALAVDGTSVYWTEASTASVRKVPKGGGAVTILATSPNVP